MYGPCPYCKGFYSKINLRNHVRLVCWPQQKDKTLEFEKTNLQVRSRSELPRIHHKACDILKYKVFPKLNDDNITWDIAYDELVITSANMLITKYSMSVHHHTMIRNKIRHIGRIFLNIKEINPSIQKVEDIFDAAVYDDYVAAIHKLGGLS